jgi:uncharacterized membrane protein (DUF485 family)
MPVDPARRPHEPQPMTAADWDRIAQSPVYCEMVAAKVRFVVPATVLFLVYYFALRVLVGYWPEMMATPVIGVLNVAYLFALSQFFMTWLLAYLYMRIAARFDRMSEQIVNEALARGGRE